MNFVSNTFQCGFIELFRLVEQQLQLANSTKSSPKLNNSCQREYYVNYSATKGTKLNFYLFCVYSVQKQYETAREEAARAQQETERLLQVVQMTQEDTNSKEKTIMDLQQ